MRSYSRGQLYTGRACQTAHGVRAMKHLIATPAPAPKPS
jgi:hypothetical protein